MTEDSKRKCPECGSDNAYENDKGEFICWCDESNNSIEAWANARELTLDQALKLGISQNEFGEIDVPDSAWPIIKSHWAEIEAKIDEANKEWAKDMDREWLAMAEERAKNTLWESLNDNKKEALIAEARAEMTENAIAQAELRAEDYYNRR